MKWLHTIDYTVSTLHIHVIYFFRHNASNMTRRYSSRLNKMRRKEIRLARHASNFLCSYANRASSFLIVSFFKATTMNRPWKDQWASFLCGPFSMIRQLSLSFLFSMVVYEGGEVVNQARSLWRLELARTKWAGGFINWMHPLRIRHITTGRYLGINENNELILVHRWLLNDMHIMTTYTIYLECVGCNNERRTWMHVLFIVTTIQARRYIGFHELLP